MKKFFIILSLFITAIILILSIRGKAGRPDESDLLTPEWRENGPFELSPERGRYALTSALIENHSVYLSTDLARFVTPDLGFRDGHYVSLFAPGLSFLVAPGYFLGQYLGGTQVGTFAFIGILGLINIYLIYAISHKLGASWIPSLVAGLIYLFGTPSFSYAVNLYQHQATTLLVLISALLSISQTSFWTLFGIYTIFGLGISLDYPNFFLLFPSTFVAFFHPSSLVITKTKFKALFQHNYFFSILGVVFPLCFFFWFNTVSNGGPLNMLGTSAIKAVREVGIDGLPIFSRPSDSVVDLQSETGKPAKGGVNYFEARNLVNGFYIHLLSPDRGVVYFTPVILLGLIGAYYMNKKNPKNTALLASVALADLLLYSMWGDPWGGWAFGSRYLIPAYAILAIFLGAFLERFRKNIPVLLVFLALSGYSIYVNTAGALSTSAIPPKVQVLELEKLSGVRERYSWDRSIEFLKAGSSKSFVYQTYLKDKISAYDYFRLIAGSIAGLIIILTISLYFSRPVVHARK